MVVLVFRVYSDDWCVVALSDSFLDVVGAQLFRIQLPQGARGSVPADEAN